MPQCQFGGRFFCRFDELKSIGRSTESALEQLDSRPGIRHFRSIFIAFEMDQLSRRRVNI
jgi:hypothetical protein